MPTLMPTDSPFGRLLRSKREEHGFSQGDLARLCSVSQGTVSRWEKGAQLPDPGTMSVLNETLDVPWEDYGREVKRRRGWYVDGRHDQQELLAA